VSLGWKNCLNSLRRAIVAVISAEVDAAAPSMSTRKLGLNAVLPTVAPRDAGVMRDESRGARSVFLLQIFAVHEHRNHLKSNNFVARSTNYWAKPESFHLPSFSTDSVS
jgi:hypothetical protein